MSHLLETAQRMAANDPTIEKIRVIPVGTIVQYFGRHGAMRQGRTIFSAVVINQHPDDGSLDLIVWFEAEDQIWEQRVRQRSETQPAHCWDFVPVVDGFYGDYDRLKEQIDALTQGAFRMHDKLTELNTAVYGEFEKPEMPLVDYLDIFDRRLQKLEKLLRK